MAKGIFGAAANESKNRIESSYHGALISWGNLV